MRTRNTKSKPRAAATPKNPPGKKSPSRRRARVVRPARVAAFDDGSLRQALVDAAVELAREGDPEDVTVREAGRRAGVSAAASARQFPSRAALMGAVAAEALRRFNGEMQRALAGVAVDDPVERLRAIGRAFIQWALRSPAHFRILSARQLIGFARLPELRDDVQDVADGVIALVAEAQRRGQWPQGSTRQVALACRALVYGLARMKIDGQLPQWGVEEDESETALLDTLDLYVDTLARAARQGGGR